MTEQPANLTTEAAPDGAAPSRILLTFAGPGMADLDCRLEGVSLGQVMAARTFLDLYVRELREQQLTTSPRLVVPTAMPTPRRTT